MIPLLAKNRQSLHLHKENFPFLSLCFSSLCVASPWFSWGISSYCKLFEVFFTVFTFFRFVFYALWHLRFELNVLWRVIYYRLRKVAFTFLNWYNSYCYVSLSDDTLIAKNRQILHLHGGKFSFHSLCFLLSVWEVCYMIFLRQTLIL